MESKKPSGALKHFAFAWNTCLAGKLYNYALEGAPAGREKFRFGGKFP
jgi:hypothetical protein